MERRVILFVIASTAIFLMWGLWVSTHKRPGPKEVLKEAHAPQEIAKPQEVKGISKEKEEGKSTLKETPPPQEEKGEEITVQTPLVKVVFSTKGASIREWKLKKYPEVSLLQPDVEEKVKHVPEKERSEYMLKMIKSVPVSHEGIELVSLDSRYLNKFPMELELVKSETELDINNKIYQLKRENVKEREKLLESLEFTLKIKDDVSITKKYIFDADSYIVRVELRTEGIEKGSYLVRWGPEFGMVPEDKKLTGYQGPVSYGMSEKGVETLTREKLKQTKKLEEKIMSRGLRWIGLENKYFVAALIVDKKEKGYSTGKIVKDDLERMTVSLQVQAPSKFLLYVGPKEISSLKAADVGLEFVVDYGFWGRLLPLGDGLRFIYTITHNYGVAIIILAVLIKILLTPLTMKTNKSMKQMQLLQPEVNKLRETYKDDAQKMNKETMALYKKHKINPLGGCLPMLLQFPFFFALYGTLSTAIELRGAGFLLWIKDLSKPDTLCHLWGIPINLLPILMGVTMLIQQKSTPTDPQHAKMGMLMTGMFTFFFYTMPSGLTLYWFITNILSIIELYWMKSRPVLSS